MTQERDELAEDSERLLTAARRVAAEKLETQEKLQQALHLIEHLRVQTQTEKAAMWGGLLRALQLTQPPPLLHEAASAISGYKFWPCSLTLARL